MQLNSRIGLPPPGPLPFQVGVRRGLAVSGRRDLNPGPLVPDAEPASQTGPGRSFFLLQWDDISGTTGGRTISQLAEFALGGFPVMRVVVFESRLGGSMTHADGGDGGRGASIGELMAFAVAQRVRSERANPDLQTGAPDDLRNVGWFDGNGGATEDVDTGGRGTLMEPIGDGLGTGGFKGNRVIIASFFDDTRGFCLEAQGVQREVGGTQGAATGVCQEEDERIVTRLELKVGQQSGEFIFGHGLIAGDILLAFETFERFGG